ncbi:ATP-binding protein [Duganella sp. HH101]|uniref:ATP-binding protein n=1 Tax=Duganella sp. HH101 TaxID=1781066 RepID=UPI00087504D3|nr:ATP-binding protein [Duganella sp. HH101]OFA03688.1 hypothetical protein DUGA2_27260 [Duganella sp. HH101]
MTEVVHCLFIARKGKPALVVNLTKTYTVTFSAPETLTVARNTKRYVTNGMKAAGVAGMAVLYGENGAGKTSAMIDMATVFGDNRKFKTAGGLYEKDGELFVRPGKALQGYAIVGKGFAVKKSDEQLRCLSVFYTTSPFDADRRRRLGNNHWVRDVSPAYGERNTFDGLSLLKVRDQLQMPFLDHAGISIRLLVRSVSNSMIAISNLIGNNRNPLVPKIRRAVMAAADELPEHEQMQLRCWLSLFVAAHERKARPFPVKFVRQLDLFLKSADTQADLYGLWKTVIRATFSCMKKDDVVQVMELLQLLSQPDFSKRLAARYTPGELQAMLALHLAGRNESLRQCTELGLLEFSLSGLSSGETAHAIIFASLHGGLERMSREGGRHPVFLLLDEGEMFLHPSWQRAYIERLLDFVRHMRRLKGRLYLVLATHSLIVAADAPPYSLVNVTSGEQVNGFGLGPRSTLADVYKVAVFQGQSSEAEFKRIEAFIRDPRRQDHEPIMKLTAALADPNVRRFLEQQVAEALERCRA